MIDGADNLSIGAIHSFDIIVDNHHTALSMGSGDVEVYATPCLILHMEAAASAIAQKGLDDGFCSVGTVVNITHSAATPVGMKVSISAKLISIDGRKLVFEVSAFDERGPIGNGLHERMVVNKLKFIERVAL